MRSGLRRRWRRWRDARRAQARLRAAEDAVRAFSGEHRGSPSGLPGQLIISLTSYPPRFEWLHKTLKSLLDQSMQPDRIILWIAQDDLDQLPDSIWDLRPHGLEILPCEDIRSYKKLVPALAAFPNAYIVTADDDVYYPRDWLAGLIAAFDPERPCVVAGRAHLMRVDDSGRAQPYAEWSFDTRVAAPPADNVLLFPTGAGGILYPPGSLAPIVSDAAAFMHLCPHGDDIWFFFAQRRAGYEQRKVPTRTPLVCWDGSQDGALFHDNLTLGRNDEQIRAVEAVYEAPWSHPSNVMA